MKLRTDRIRPRFSTLRLSCAIWAAPLLVFPTASRADLSFETETARMPISGQMEFSVAGEYQHSKEGGEFALPFAFEVGLLPRLALLVEPTPYVGIYHKGQKRIHGVGDTEVTATYLLSQERDALPAFAMAGEIKAPTARDLKIGTRKIDYALYLIASKRLANVDVHANIAYTFLGKPAGVKVQDTVLFALAADLALNPSSDVFAEVTYTTSALGGSGEGVGVAAEIGVDELIGTVGLRRHFSRTFLAFGSLSYDNAHAALVRTGLTWIF